MFLLPALLQNPLYSLSPPLLLQSSPSEHLRGSLTGLNPQKFCQIKHNSQRLGCAVFQSTYVFKIMDCNECIIFQQVDCHK